MRGFGVGRHLKTHHGRSLLSFRPGRGALRISESIPKVPFDAESKAVHRLLLAFVPLLAMMWAADLSAQIPGSYQIDTAASHIQIYLFRGGFLSMLGDNHLIALEGFSGTAQLLDGKPWWVRMLAEAQSLTVLDPWGSTSERRDVTDTMRGPSQLDIQRYPLIKLQSTSIVHGQQVSDWRLVADLTFHGVTRQVEFLLDCQQTGDRLRVRGKKDLRLRDFNIQPISRGLGAVKVKNEFEVTYDITLVRKP
jgi:polyisoprenoid-binding protein YceI